MKHEKRAQKKARSFYLVDSIVAKLPLTRAYVLNKPARHLKKNALFTGFQISESANSPSRQSDLPQNHIFCISLAVFDGN